MWGDVAVFDSKGGGSTGKPKISLTLCMYSPLEVQTKKNISFKLAIPNRLLEYLNVSIITIQDKFEISSSNVPVLASSISITSLVSVPVS